MSHIVDFTTFWTDYTSALTVNFSGQILNESQAKLGKDGHAIINYAVNGLSGITASVSSSIEVGTVTSILAPGVNRMGVGTIKLSGSNALYLANAFIRKDTGNIAMQLPIALSSTTLLAEVRLHFDYFLS